MEQISCGILPPKELEKYTDLFFYITGNSSINHNINRYISVWGIASLWSPACRQCNNNIVYSV